MEIFKFNDYFKGKVAAKLANKESYSRRAFHLSNKDGTGLMVIAIGHFIKIKLMPFMLAIKINIWDDMISKYSYFITSIFIHPFILIYETIINDDILQ